MGRGRRDSSLIIGNSMKKTIDDKYPIPDIKMILSNLGKGKVFSTIDLKSGFHQILMAETDREKTAFSVSNGKYEFCRLPFGLKNAPSIFQRCIDDVLRPFIGVFLYVYMDYVIIFSDNHEDHLQHLQLVFESLYNANMRISIEKSKYFKSSVEFLGFVLSEKGIATCPNKVEATLIICYIGKKHQCQDNEMESFH